MPSGGNFTACNCGPDTAACESPTQPVATVGLCLADGTPIAVTVVRDCAGSITSQGWINLVTGQFSAGAAPAGTIACGDSRSIQVSGTFCDLDPATGDVLGLVLIEYSYAADGSIAGVRLVDAVTGDTYTPAGEISVCPAGVEQPEGDLAVLCDRAADGAVTTFVRDWRRDENGQITGFTDYDLDGGPYTPAGQIGACELAGEESPAEPCASTVTTLRLCDLNPDAPPNDEGLRCAVPFLRHLVHDCTGALVQTRDTAMDGQTPYTPVEAVDCGSGGLPAMVEVPWNVVDIAPDPDSDPGRGFIFTLSPDDDPSTTGTVKVTTTATANTACPGTPPSYNFRNPCTYRYEPDQALRDAATYVRVDLQDFDTFEPVTGLTPPPSRLGGTAYWDGTTVRPTASNGTGQMYYDGPPQAWQFRVGNTGGGNSCSSLSFAAVSLRAEGCCAPCGEGAGGGDGRTVQTVCVTTSADPDTVAQWTRVIDADGTTYYLDPTGTRYDDVLPPGHTIVACPATEPCRDAASVLLCDVPTDGTAGPLTANDTTPPTPGTTDGSIVALPGGAPALWAGGQLVFPADADASAGDGDQVYRAVAATLTADRPTCDDGTATVTASVHIRLDGPSPGLGTDGRMSLFADGVKVATAAVPMGVPVGYEATLTVSAQVAASAVAAGTVIAEVWLETFHGGGKSWTASDFTSDVAFDVTGCATQFLRKIITDCRTGETISVTDTTLDGAPYTPAGHVGRCESSGGGDEGCSTCQTLTLCDAAGEESPGEGEQVPWSVVSVEPDPDSEPGHGFLFRLSPDGDPSQVGTVRVTSGTQANTACAPSGPFNLSFNNTNDLTFELDAVAQQMSYLRVDLGDFDDFEPVQIHSGSPDPTRLGGTAMWDAGHTQIVPTESNGTGQMYWDAPPATFGYRIWNTGGGTSCSSLNFAGVTVLPPPPAGTARSFLRTVCRDCWGVVVSVTDTEMDGQTPYVPAGEVVECAAVGGGQDPTEPCRATSSVLLCERTTTADSSGELTATVLPDATPFNGWSAYGQPTNSTWCQVNGDAETLFEGGSATYGPGGACADGAYSMHEVLAAVLGADVGTCASVEVTVSVRIHLNGPNPGVGGDGVIALWNQGTGTRLAAKRVANGAQVGHTETISLAATVTGADLAAGNIVVSVDLETEHNGAKTWLADQFTAGYAASECEATEGFLRHVVTDCDGGVVSQSDTDLDGAPITVSGEVGACQPTGGQGGEPCGDTEVIQLCDTADDGSAIPFLRHLTHGCDGAVISVTDTDLDGTSAYVPAGTVGTCAEPCRDTSSTLLCDTSAADLITVMDPANVAGADGWEVMSFTGANPGYGPEAPLPYPARYGSPHGYPALGARDDQSAGHGSSWAGYDLAPVRWVLRKTFIAPEDGVAIAQSTGFRGDGGARVRINGIDAGMYGQWNQPATSGTAQIPVTAGPNTVEIEVRDVGGINNVIGRLDIAMPRTVQFMRRQTVDCQTGDVISTVDTTLDGDPYEVVGEVGQCEPVAECCEAAPPELRVDVETELTCMIDEASGDVVARVRIERVYDDQSGDLVETRITDPVTGDPVQVPAGAVIGSCEAPCPQAFSTECVGVASRSEASYDNTSLIGGQPGQCGSVQGPTDGGAGANFGCGGGPYTITSWIVNGVEVIAEGGGRTFNGGPCGPGTTANPGMHRNWAEALTNLDPTGATWVVDSQPACAWYIRSQGGSGTVYGPMTITGDGAVVTGGTWVLGPTQACDETQFTRVYRQDCDGGISVVWLDQAGNEVEAPEGEFVRCGTGCSPAGGDGLDVEVVTLCDVQPDGTSVPFLRHVLYDTGGAVALVTDTDLGGLAPYSPSGQVGVCEPDPARHLVEECRCDDTDGDGAADTDFVEVIAVEADGSLTSVGTYTADMSGPYAPVAPVACPAAGSPGPELDAQAVVLCDIDGAGQATPFIRHLRYNAAGEVIAVADTALDGATAYAPAGTVDHCGDGGGGFEVELTPLCVIDTITGGVIQEILAEVIYDTGSGGQAGVRYVDRATFAPVALPGGTRIASCPRPEPECPAQVIEACRCDDTTGDGAGDTDYTELLAVSCAGEVTSLGTYTADLSAPYAPVAPVPCADAGAAPVTGVQAGRVELAPGASWSAATVAGLQSVTATAHEGTGAVTTAEGVSTLHSGESVSWSVSRDADAALTGPLTIAADTGTVTVAFTRTVTL